MSAASPAAAPTAAPAEPEPAAAPAESETTVFGVAAAPLADWREIFEGPDPAAAFWDETSECLSQFADMFDIADKDAEEYAARSPSGPIVSSRVLTPAALARWPPARPCGWLAC